jgi:integrase
MPRPRRDRGTGTVYQEASGRWVAKLDLGWRDGKRWRPKVTAATRAAVLAKLATLQRQQARGEIAADARQPLRVFLETWLETVQKPRLAATTYDRESMIVRHHLTPALGHRPLGQLTTAEIQRYFATSPLAPTTQYLHMAVLRGALGVAVRWRLLSRNPAADVTLPPKRLTRERLVLDAGPAQAFLMAAQGDRLEALWVLALTTAARIGELLALRWADVDLDHGVVVIQRGQAHLRDGTHVEGPPKTPAGLRRIDLVPRAVAALRRHRAQQRTAQLAASRWAPSDRIFTNRWGAPTRPENAVRLSLARILERAGLPAGITPHALRRSWCSLALKEGEDVAVVARVMGHARIDTTLAVYRQLYAGETGRAVRRVDALFGDDPEELGAQDGAQDVEEPRPGASC